MDEDKQYLLRNGLMSEDGLPRHGSKTNRWLNWNVGALVANVLLLIAGVAVWARVNSSLKKFNCGSKPDFFEPDREFCHSMSVISKSLLTPAGTVVFDTPVVFQPYGYYGGVSNSSNDAWKRLMPPGDGIVEIPNEHTHDLPPSLPAPNNPGTSKVYGISMFHQLHCLNFIRYAYEPESIKDYPADEVVYHRDHCIDYIRQAIMCNGDVTFEPLTEVGINGIGATHMCRSYDKMFAWAYKHRSDKKDDGYPPGKVTHTPADRNMLESAHPHVHGGH